MDKLTRPALALILLATWMAYRPVSAAPFVYEDAHYFRGGGDGPWRIPGRQLTLASFALTTEPAAAHRLNVALHLVNGALVYVLGLQLAGPTAAILALVTVLWHPLFSEAVAYAAGRAELLVTTWTLLAIVLAIAWIDRAGWWRVLGSLAALGAAAVSKEVGVLAVPLVMLTIAIWRPRRVPTTLLLTGLLVLGTVALSVAGPRLEAWSTLGPLGGGTSFTWLQFVRLQTTAVATLVTLIVAPWGRLSIDHDAIGNAAQWSVAADLLLLYLAGLGVLAWRRGWSVTLWALAWIALVVGPRFLFPTSEFISEYQFYTAMPAVAISVGVAGAALLSWVSPAFAQKEPLYART